MGRGPEWSYVEEITHGRNVSRLKCKSCGHTFTGGASRIKEHLFQVTGNVGPCSSPPIDIHVKLAKYAVKLKAESRSGKKRFMKGAMHGSSSGVDMTHEDVHMENIDVGVQASQCDPDATFAPAFGTPMSGSRVSSSQTLHAAFDKQGLLELHLKWTQAFMACGISFNVIQNPIFQDALMSTAKKGFVLPDYNRMRTEYVDKVKSSTEAILKRTVLDFIPAFGCTIAFDGWTSCQKKPLINVMVICPKGTMFLEAIDTSLKEKTSLFIAKVYERAIAKVGGSKNVTAIVTDNASNYKGAGRAIEEKYPEITWVPCAAHTLNLLLKDIGKLSFVKQTLLEANAIVKFIREHQYSYALFRSKSPTKTLQTFCATRFATAFYVLNGLQAVRPALNETVADRHWDAWVSKYPALHQAAANCTQLIQSSTFWRNLDKVVGVCKPFVELLRVVDTDKFVFGKVYWLMSEAIKTVRGYTNFTAREKSQVTTLANTRWVQMHTPLHGAAFVLDPKFQIHDQASNPEVMANFKKVCLQFLPSDDGKEAFHQRVHYANCMGMFGDPWHLEAINKVNGAMWWKEYGGELMELQHIATRVLSVAASSGSCERNWSAYDFIHSKRRNRLNPARAEDLVYVFCNMRLIHAPKSIAIRAAQASFGHFQTHETIADEKLSEDEMDWELLSDCSNMEEVDDLVPVLEET